MTSSQSDRPGDEPLDPDFWRTKPLHEFSKQEWEAVCDGCAKCCVVRLRDDDTHEVHDTNVACRLLDAALCRCTQYADRHQLVPGCVSITPASVAALDWMPRTCAYRLLANGEPLRWWHHLVSGSRETVHEAGMSVRGATVPEADVPEPELVNHVVIWPGERSDP